jgi:hypothetical protein
MPVIQSRHEAFKPDSIFVTILFLPRVEAGKNTSTVIPANRKRRQKGNSVVSGETVPGDLRKRLMRTYH